MFDKNKILRGNFGALWINNEEVAEIKSFEAKVNIEYEDVNIIGEMGTDKRMMGYTGEGTAVLHKINSRIVRMMSENINKGILPNIKMVAKLDDPTAEGEERVEFTRVSINELMVLAFKNKELREEEVPFSFAKYRLLDSIK